MGMYIPIQLFDFPKLLLLDNAEIQSSEKCKIQKQTIATINHHSSETSQLPADNT